MITEYLPSAVVSTLLGAIAVIFADTFMGVCVSLKYGTFNIRELPKFLVNNVLPYIGGLIILALASTLSEELGALFYAADAAVMAKFMVEIKDKVAALFGKDDIYKNKSKNQ